jgi:hypothetical protein
MSDQQHTEDTQTGRWLSIPEVCAYLKITPDEWADWRAKGDTPLHIIGRDGQARIRRCDLARWLEQAESSPDDVPCPCDGLATRLSTLPGIGHLPGGQLVARTTASLIYHVGQWASQATNHVTGGQL